MENPLKRWQPDYVLLLLAAVFLAAAVAVAALRPHTYVEERETLPCARGINWHHLPVREYQHCALPIYFIKLSGLIFGTSNLGFRMVNIFAGLGSILAIYALGLRWRGRTTARLAAALLVLDWYHLYCSTIATELAFDLLFVSLAMAAFARFLEVERPAWLYAAAAATGLAFLTKEINALLVGVYFLSLLFSSRRRWLLGFEPWLALGVFVLVISPDLLHNLMNTPEGRPPTYANYLDHLSRCGGIGWNEYPLLFYFGAVPMWLGIANYDYVLSPSAAAIFLLGAGLAVRFGGSDPTKRFLLLMFWTVFLFFSLILPHEPVRAEVHLVPVSIYWVDRTVLPGALLAAMLIAGLASGKKEFLIFANGKT
jgi:4-amino-4-deoxy-L-arabinose transferase-like glycosyltransferase